GIDIAAGRVRNPAAKEEIGTFLTDRHGELSPVFVLRGNSPAKPYEMVNAAVTMFRKLCPKRHGCYRSASYRRWLLRRSGASRRPVRPAVPARRNRPKRHNRS